MIPTSICVCGHEKIYHIYEEGSCRPGYICEAGCTKFVPRPPACPHCGSTTGSLRERRPHGNDICLSCQGTWPSAKQIFTSVPVDLPLKIAEQKNEEVRKTLAHALEQAEGFEAVVVLALTKDGGQWLRTSNMSGYQKSLLKCFFDAWMVKWFNIQEDPE